MLSSLPAFYVYAVAALAILLVLVRIASAFIWLGHRILDLLRDYRDFREGH